MEVTNIQPLPPVQSNATAVPASQREATLLPRAATVQSPNRPSDGQIQNNLSDAKRQNLVQRAAERIRDLYPLGSTVFVIFKDSSGQLITRFTDLRSGKVTYIPEPNILAYDGGASADSEGLVRIDA